MKWYKHLFTGKDNETQDLGRWSWALSLFAVIAAAIWNATRGALIDLWGLASAIGAVVGAHGGALWMKKDTEPKEKSDGNGG